MPIFTVIKEPLALWSEPGEKVEINDPNAIRNLLRDGRIEPVEETQGEPLSDPKPEAPAENANPA